MVATKSITDIASILSNIPPCPGNRFEKSLTPDFLFIDENARSPRGATTESKIPINIEISKTLTEPFINGTHIFK